MDQPAETLPMSDVRSFSASSSRKTAPSRGIAGDADRERRVGHGLLPVGLEPAFERYAGRDVVVGHFADVFRIFATSRTAPAAAIN